MENTVNMGYRQPYIGDFDCNSGLQHYMEAGNIHEVTDYFENVEVLNGIDFFSKPADIVGYNTLGQLGGNNFYNSVAGLMGVVNLSGSNATTTLRVELQPNFSDDCARWIANGWPAGITTLVLGGVMQAGAGPFQVLGGQRRFMFPRNAFITLSGAGALQYPYQGNYVFMKNVATNDQNAICSWWDRCYRFGKVSGTEPVYCVLVNPVTFNVTLLPANPQVNAGLHQSVSKENIFFSCYVQTTNVTPATPRVTIEGSLQKPEQTVQFYGKRFSPRTGSSIFPKPFFQVTII